MRVLFLSTSGHLGGAERVLVDMVRATVATGGTAGVVTVEDGPLTAAVAEAGGETVSLPLPRSFGRTGESHAAIATMAAVAASAPPLLAYSRRLTAAIQAWQPDIVHSNGIKMHVLSSRAPSPALVWHLHDYVGPRRLSRRLLKHFADRPTVIAATSNDLARDAVRALGRDDIVVLPNGVDLDRFRPTGTHADLDGLAGLSPASAGTVRVGLVATYARWKGHETFIRALAQLAGRLPIRGYIVGSPVYRSTAAQVRDEELRALAQSMGVTAHLGFVPFQADPAPVYRALDVVVHASTSPEPFGLVVAEAMACGRAVVATTLGGVAEVADEEVASLHIAGDAGDLARAIGRCANDERTRASLGAAARARAEQRFSLVRFGQDLGRLHRAALRRSGVTA
jgi:glycosyltransferase involved in cell wall biosynthesis